MKNTWVAVALTIVAGAAGSLGSVFALGHGTYDVSPLRVRVAIKPAASGSTVLSVEPIAGLSPGRATAGTHRGPLKLEATVVGVDPGGLAGAALSCVPPSAQTCTLDPSDPQSVARFIAEGSSGAAKRFGVKLAILTVAGGFLGGLIVSMGSWKRMVGGLVAGTLVVGGLGALAKLTYDTSKFSGTRFGSSSSP